MPPAAPIAQPAVSEEVIEDIHSGTRRYIRENHAILFGTVLIVCIAGSVALAVSIVLGLRSGSLRLGSGDFLLPLAPLLIPLGFYAHFRSVVTKVFLRQLAEAIGFTYVGNASYQSVSGTFFSRGHSPRLSNALTGTHKEHPCRIYEYQYTEGSGKNSHTYTYTVFEMAYSSSLPHVLINASSLFTPLKMERVELEGDFDKSFSVYVDQGKQMEVREILQPDVMQDLIASFEGFGMEMSGSNVYVFRKDTITNRTAFLALIALVDKLFDEILPGLRAASS